MAYNFLNYSGEEGIIPLVFSIRDAVPLGFEAVLMTFLLIVSAGSYFANNSENARGRIVVSFASGSFVAVILAVFFAMMGVISASSLMFFVTLSIISFMILILYK